MSFSCPLVRSHLTNEGFSFSAPSVVEIYNFTAYNYLCSCVYCFFFQATRHMKTKYVLSFKMEESIECLDCHLKEICFNDYRATTVDLRFAVFFFGTLRC